MKVTCTLCGRVEELPKWHRDYSRDRGDEGTYICEACSARVHHEAKKAQDPGKPL